MSKVCMDPACLPPLLSPLPPHLTPVLSGAQHGRQWLSQRVGVGLSMPLRLISITAVHCVALRGERYRDADSVSISLTTQCHATQRTAAVMEISL